jgi:hypothetical protein
MWWRHPPVPRKNRPYLLRCERSSGRYLFDALVSAGHDFGIEIAATAILPPVLAAAAMATSSVTVVGNALRLRRFGKGGGQASPPHRGAATPASLEPAVKGAAP